MYYENKFRFYIKQYGIQIIVGIICFIIVLSGLFIHFKINNKSQKTTFVSGSTENNVDTNNQIEDDSILPENLRALKAGEKITAKIVSTDNEGSLVIVTGNQRIKAKLIGADFSEIMPDTYYVINNDLEGKSVEISFDEHKVSNQYAMIYVYTENDSLYNAKILENGKLILDSTVSKKALEYNNLAESQAYAKQTLAGVWGE